MRSGCEDVSKVPAAEVIGAIRSPCQLAPKIPLKPCTYRLGGLEVDHQFELGRLFDRQIGNLLALQKI
jgi:hypothetical protein